MCVLKRIKIWPSVWYEENKNTGVKLFKKKKTITEDKEKIKVI